MKINSTEDVAAKTTDHEACGCSDSCRDMNETFFWRGMPVGVTFSVVWHVFGVSLPSLPMRGTRLLIDFQFDVREDTN